MRPIVSTEPTRVNNLVAGVASLGPLAVRDLRNLRCQIEVAGAALSNARITIAVSYKVAGIPLSISQV